VVGNDTLEGGHRAGNRFLAEEGHDTGSVPALKGIVPNHGPFNAMDPFHFTNLNGIPGVM
jgi:hypothetical protein